ncbi:hypothetical protein L7F22_006724, partial [Adiantum nelumboides]|nr:hypothetical protein [Adiantum nelumboides]
MLRYFGRLVKKEQDLMITSLGILEVPFDIVQNPIFKITQSLVLAAMHRSLAKGVCKDRKKALVIGVTLEEEILCNIDFSLLHGCGCQMQSVFYCLLHILMQGGLELYKLERAILSCGNDELESYGFKRCSKNYKVWFNWNILSLKSLSSLVKSIGEKFGFIDKRGSSAFASSGGKENVGIVLESKPGPRKVLELGGSRLESSVGGNNGP